MPLHLPLAAAALLALAPTPPAADPIRITHNYTEQLNAAIAAIPEDQRAWPRYRDIADGLRPALVALGDLSFDSTCSPADADWPRLEAFIRGHAGAIERLRDASRLPAMGYILADADGAENPVLNDVLQPQLGTARLAVRLFVADARVALHEGDAHRLTENLLAVLRTAEHTREHPFIINGLVALAALDRFLDVAADALETRPDLLRDRDLAAIAAAAERFAGGGLLRPDLDAERLILLDVLQRTYTDDGHGNGVLTPEGVREFDRLLAASQAGQPTLADLLETYPEFGDQFWRTVPDRGEMLAEFDRLARCPKLHDPLWRWDSEPCAPPSDEWKARFVVLGILVPALEKAAAAGEVATLRRDGLLTAIAIERFRREHGRLPDRLDDLVPGFLPGLLPDRFTGRPLLLHADDNAIHIYASGPDRDDDRAAPTDPPNAPRRWIFGPDAQAVPEGDWPLVRIKR